MNALAYTEARIADIHEKREALADEAFSTLQNAIYELRTLMLDSQGSAQWIFDHRQEITNAEMNVEQARALWLQLR